MGKTSSTIAGQTIAELLRSTGLHAESLSFFWQRSTGSTYYGFNVSKTEREPIDQIHGFIAAARLQQAQQRDGSGRIGTFHAFVAGQFEVLNARNVDELEQTRALNEKKDLTKKQLFEQIFRRFQMNGKVWVSQDLFS